MSKGRRRERQAAELYERAGYQTYRPQHSKWGETDMFNLFDLMAIGHGQVRLVQVKSTSSRVAYGPWFDAVADWCREIPDPPPNVIPDFLVCYKHEGWRLIGLQHYPPDEPKTWVDERDEDGAMGDLVVEYLGGDVDG